MPIPAGLSQKEVVAYVMGEFKRGKLYSRSGRKVTSRKQAVAIALSQAGIGYDSVPDPRKEKAIMAKKGRKKTKKRSKKRKKTARKRKFKISKFNKAIKAGASESKAKAYARGEISSLAKAAGKRKTSKKTTKKTAKKAKKRGRKKVSKRRKQASRKAAPKKRAARKAAPSAPRRSRKKGEVSVTADKVLSGRTPGQAYHWICSGYKRTGCGGGKRGGHVTGHLGTTRYRGKKMTTFTPGQLRSRR